MSEERLYHSPLLAAAAADPAAMRAAFEATGLSRAAFRGLTQEMRRVAEATGGGRKYAALRAFLDALDAS